MTSASPRVLTKDVWFAEGPRFHADRLWFSDMHAGSVHTLSLDGELKTIAHVAASPSGLGFDPEGRLLVVAMRSKQVLRSRARAAEAGSAPLELLPFVDLSQLAPERCNDMVVDAHGRAYVGNFGFDLFSRQPPTPTCLLLVTPDGRARVVAEDLLFPNGMVITPDGRTLIVAETFARRLTAFDIAPDGGLSGRRVFAELGVLCDGIALDAEGCVWVANPAPPGGFLRVAEGGEVRAQLSASGSEEGPPPAGVFEAGARGRAGYACALGGPERRTLFMLEAFSSSPAHSLQGNGRIRCVEVEVAGAGWP